MKKVALFIFASLLLGCVSSKAPKVIQGGQKEDFMYYAISEFINSCNLYKKHTVFSVSFNDTVYGLTFKQIDEYSGSWVADSIYADLVVVSITPSDETRWLYGKRKHILPSKYFERDGKFFYFSDYPYEYSEEAVKVFQKYGLLQDDDDGLAFIAEYAVNDAQKGVDYYFCRNNVLNYKRVITARAVGYYKPPKLKCDECEK